MGSLLNSISGSLSKVKRLYTAPWWLFILLAMWIWVIIQMQSNPDYGQAFNQIKDGIPLTIWLALSSYVIALIIGLLAGILRSAPPEPPETLLSPIKLVKRFLYTILYNLVTVYIEFMRGIPPLVFLLIAGFIIVPIIREPILTFLNTEVLPIIRSVNPEASSFQWRGRDAGTAIAGLSLIYGAFLSEVFRAGIQAVPKGQVEASKSLGMTSYQTMRYIVIPQAVRNVLPPLGNNFISMIKDTSLVTILGTTEITQIARRWSGSQFTYLETYAVLSLVYLTMTVSGSMLVQFMEQRLRRFAKK